ncbi:unnamed protein product [Chondrus crispus]|uniref:Uncharacterized protein n=1 Tax=Chondrus crispus TaxID=2769 RepID=R7QLC3_CHOCR|nr:unnamed protein product [Chondrus crispus]CDF38553.1 unnamed protein product [Chondrus crispus]|eukprot:XP_005718446.1 unnamed protein product [Chondrus crispus]
MSLVSGTSPFAQWLSQSYRTLATSSCAFRARSCVSVLRISRYPLHLYTTCPNLPTSAPSLNPPLPIIRRHCVDDV